MQSGYERSLKWSIGHQPFILATFFVSLLLTGVLFYFVKGALGTFRYRLDSKRGVFVER